jgi:hypothetical protein
VILLCYIAAGAILYATYGLRKSRLGQAWTAAANASDGLPAKG